jgi:predicted transcriptional regulator YdeE
MEEIKTGGFKLIGIKLPNKTSNEGGQSMIDCGNLWRKFTTENIKEKIPGKISDDILAVYYSYDGDHTQPFSYFIGCKVKMDTRTPADLKAIFIPAGKYRRSIAKGPMPDCIGDAWKRIWASKLERAYQYDFEVYGEKSRDWRNAEVEIYLS